MRYRIELHPRVVAFASALPMEARREAKVALSALADWKGNIRALEGRLAGYYRLRVGRNRFVFHSAPARKLRVIFAAPRPVVYDMFERMVESGDFSAGF